jgi:Na+-transporting NADH:ubiquinone oxidoreductase subunit C
MPDNGQPEPRGLMGRFKALPNESVAKMVVVTILLSLVCSILVSSAAVFLKPLQDRNVELARKSRILEVAGLLEPEGNVEELFQQVEVRLVDLESGTYAVDMDPASYDQRLAARDPEMSKDVPPWEDIAGINRRANYAPVYLVSQGGRLTKVVIPVHGYGLWSTMYGFLALSGDGQTVEGLTFYQHAETPGLGGEIENPRWLAKWAGKSIYDPEGEVELQVVKGYVDPASEEARSSVDGISGATLTAQGVSRMVRYWLGEEGFGPYLERLKQEKEAA